MSESVPSPNAKFPKKKVQINVTNAKPKGNRKMLSYMKLKYRSAGVVEKQDESVSSSC